MKNVDFKIPAPVIEVIEKDNFHRAKIDGEIVKGLFSKSKENLLKFLKVYNDEISLWQYHGRPSSILYGCERHPSHQQSIRKEWSKKGVFLDYPLPR